MTSTVLNKNYLCVILFIITFFSGCTLKFYEQCDECDCEDTDTEKDDKKSNSEAENSSLDSSSTIDNTAKTESALWEGEACISTSECRDGLTCIATDAQNQFPSICARSCEMDSDCDTDLGEVCYEYTGLESDRHCSIEMDKEYGLCHLASLTHCASPMICMIYSIDLMGMCVTECDVETNGEDECETGQECLSGFLMDETYGICGNWAERGESCELAEASLCREDDICSPDLEDLKKDWTCRQICDPEEDSCDEGTCTEVVEGQYVAYVCY